MSLNFVIYWALSTWSTIPYMKNFYVSPWIMMLMFAIIVVNFSFLPALSKDPVSFYNQLLPPSSLISQVPSRTDIFFFSWIIADIYSKITVAEEREWRNCIQDSDAVVNLAGLAISTRWSLEVHVLHLLSTHEPFFFYLFLGGFVFLLIVVVASVGRGKTFFLSTKR